MSGGYFNYDQNRIDYIIERLEQVIEKGRYGEDTLMQFRAGVDALRLAKIFATRIDWLLSGDDAEDTFHERLEEELNNWETAVCDA